MNLQWHTQLHPVAASAVLIGIGVWLYFLRRRMLSRMSARRVAVVLAPKIAVVSLLVLALFEPVWMVEQRDDAKGRLLAVLDVSSSMDVMDRGSESRAERARRIVDEWEKQLPGGMTVERVEFDTTVRAPGTKPAGVRGTDIGGALAALADRADIASFAGVALLTDGGDELIENIAVPPVPVSVVGIGSDPATWSDVAIEEVQFPATVEKEIEFEISADIVARAGTNPSFLSGLSSVPVTLEREQDGAWVKAAEETADLRRLRTRMKFKQMSRETGLRRYRLTVTPRSGELSALNNAREIAVDVQKKALHVLFFTRELGNDFKMIRAELARDPGITFTALFRTISERFTVQGDRQSGDDELEAGFPTSEKTLKLFDCVIIGSFAAEEWTAAQLEVLRKYAEQGGAVIFLGGEKSFGRGGYAGTAAAALFPWQVAGNEPDLELGVFPVMIPLASKAHAIVSGMERLLATESAALESVNMPGPLRAGATALLQANVGNRNVAVVAVQPYGQGKVLGVASNTMWKWARLSQPMRDAYGLFWRQAVRDLTGNVEGGRVISVRWDKDGYRPGEQAMAEVRVAGQEGGAALRLSATLAHGNDSRPVTVEPMKGQPDTYAVKAQFRERGEYQFRLVAYQGDSLLETYEKTMRIAPRMDEGARLEVDEVFLRKLAERSGGKYFREEDSVGLAKELSAGVARRKQLVERPLAQTGPWYALMILTLLVTEWVLRRKSNLF